MVKEEGFTILFEGNENVADIILVHGLGGSPTKTWTRRRRIKSEKSWPHHVVKGYFRDRKQGAGSTVAEERDVFWPRDLLPETVKNARIMTYGYDSRVFKFSGTVNQNGIYEHAQNMLYGIERQRGSCPHRPLIIVAHSLGGVITKEMLRQSEAAKHQPHLLSVFQSTIGVIFFGCPHRGATLAELGVILGHLSRIAFGSANIKLIRSLETTADMLNIVNDAFANYLKENKLKVHSFHEEKGMLGQHGIMGKVVERPSSVIGDAAEGTEGINANHVGMVAFESLDDEGFIKVSNVIKRYLCDMVDGAKELNDEHIEECLQTLSFSDTSNRYNDISNPHKNTCKWIEERNAVGFPEWRENGQGIFWIKGKPGSGKSILLKYLLSEARRHAQTPQSIAGFFFNGRGFPLEHCIEGMIRSLLVQLLPQFPASFSFILTLYKQKLSNREGGQFLGPIRWSRSDLQQTLISVIGTISAAQRVLLFLDALDECDGLAMDTVEFLQEIINQNSSQEANIKICVTTRPVGTIITSLISGPVLQLEQHIAEDISAYTESSIAYLGGTEGFAESAKYFKAEIIQKANGVFLWVTLVTEALRKGFFAGDSVSELRRTLSSTPSGLSDLYRHTLGKVDEQYRVETGTMFRTVLTAKRPLSLAEFRYILAFESTPSFSSQQEMSASSSAVQDDRLMENRILSRCGGLLEVVSNGPKDCRTVQFIHQSVSDFLIPDISAISNVTVDKQTETHTGINGNWVLLKSCVHYLSIAELKDIRTTLRAGKRSTLVRKIRDTFQEYPLLEYAAKYWTTHWKILDHRQTPQNESLDLHLENLDLQSWIQIYNLCNDLYISHPQDANILTIAIESNVCSFVSANRQHLDLTAENGRFGYPLVAACALGHHSMAELLISYGADVNMQGGPLENALQAASIMGHDHMVSSLIAWGANVNARGTRYGTALHVATRNGDEDVVSLLLQHGADVSIVHGMEGSAMHVAASRGFQPIVRMFVNSGADLDLLDGDGWAPLACAWLYRHHSTLKLLSTSSLNASSFDGPVGLSPSKLRVIGGAAGIALSEDAFHISSDKLVHAAAACSDHCMPIGRYIYYFEVRIIRTGENNEIGIGFCTLGPDVLSSGMPGWTYGSCGYHGDDGAKLDGNGKPLSYGPTYGKGDVVGCGVDFNDMSAFFTKNGRHLGRAFTEVDKIGGKLYPMVGIAEPGVEVEVNLGQHKFLYDLR